MKQSQFNTLLSTILALIAFAANSVLCRLALGQQSIDPASFTLVRLVSGALMLVLICQIPQGNKKRPRLANSVEGAGSQSVSSLVAWWPALMLFTYAVSFSFAYITLDTATGAVILFGVVQLTIIIGALFRGERLHQLEWLGVMIAFSGFLYLMLPTFTTPSFGGFVLMTLAGMAWGIYTLLGKGSRAPLLATRYNFVKTMPMVLLLALVWLVAGSDSKADAGYQYSMWMTLEGAGWAILSGAIASGIGYTLWYIALRGLSSAQAGVAQLLVPVIAALGGVVFVGEVISLRLLTAIILILGGIGLVMMGRHQLVSQRFQGSSSQV